MFIHQHKYKRSHKPSVLKRFDFVKILRPSAQQVRRIRVIATLMIIVGASLWIRNLLINPAHWPIAQISIEGQLNYVTENTLREIVHKYSQTNLYQLDDINLENDLEAIAWIKDIKLRKSWPASLVIYVEEHRPIAYWGEQQLLDQYGEIFEGKLPDDRADFPRLYSPENKGREMGEHYLQVLKWLKDVPLHLISLKEDARGSWVISFDEGLLVKIGVYDQEKRLRRFVAAYQAILSEQLDKINVVDLRYTNGFAVEWK
jgi:cell division protein FtsQ